MPPQGGPMSRSKSSASARAFGCAALVVLGLGTRLAALPVVFAMGVAAFVAHGSDPWTMGEGAKLFMSGASKSWGSKEPALLFLIPFLALVFTGPGLISLDALIGMGCKRKAGSCCAGGACGLGVVCRIADHDGAARVADVIGKAMEFVPKERIVAGTNCGMAPMRRDIAEAKLVALGKGAALARQRYA